MLRKCWGYASPICLVWLGMTRYDSVWPCFWNEAFNGRWGDKTWQRKHVPATLTGRWTMMDHDGPWWTMMAMMAMMVTGSIQSWLIAHWSSSVATARLESECVETTLGQHGQSACIGLHKGKMFLGVMKFWGTHTTHKSYLAGFSQIKIFQQVYRVIKVSIWWKRMSSQATGKRQTLMAG